jgi:large subunit ribosomal protein L1
MQQLERFLSLQIRLQINAKELIDTLNKLKPTAAKGVIHVKSIYMSSTMSPSVQLDTKA